MSGTRRDFLKQAGAFSAIAITALMQPNEAFADWVAQNFAPSQLPDTLKRLFSGSQIAETGKIELKLPQIAENGAVVPITVSSTLANVETISILVEKNPVPLAATFKFAPNMMPFVSARLKMAETCDVIVIVKADDMLFSARRKVKVTIGGCGG